MKKRIYLQLFGEGEGAAPSSDSGAAAATGVEGDSPVSQKEDLSKVIYGKPEIDQEEDSTSSNQVEETFDSLIKKDGKYHDEFNKRTQKIIDKRFAETKKLEETLKSHEDIFDILASKYGVDASDAKALLDAINEDDSLFEQEAYDKGISVEQLKYMKKLERENKAFAEAKEIRERETRSKEIYANWLNEADQMVSKYGLTNFDLQSELLDENFTRMLSNGISLEAAYKAIHFDQMMNGAMAATAKNVESAVSNRVASRSTRPNESAITSTNATSFRSDVSKFTNEDMDEVIRRAARGERVVL